MKFCNIVEIEHATAHNWNNVANWMYVSSIFFDLFWSSLHCSMQKCNRSFFVCLLFYYLGLHDATVLFMKFASLVMYHTQPTPTAKINHPIITNSLIHNILSVLKSIVFTLKFSIIRLCFSNSLLNRSIE